MIHSAEPQYLQCRLYIGHGFVMYPFMLPFLLVKYLYLLDTAEVIVKYCIELSQCLLGVLKLRQHPLCKFRNGNCQKRHCYKAQKRKCHINGE